MRQIILDTETTGLDPNQGHRIIEIGCVELIDRRITNNNFHIYLNPERSIEQSAIEVHGLSDEFLKDKPLFVDIADDFAKYLSHAELIIHNAPFDLSFLENEFRLIQKSFKVISQTLTITDSLLLARSLHPGQKNSLDALKKRYEINHIDRGKHGALLDAQILAYIYLAMTGGQGNLFEQNNKDINNKNIYNQSNIKDSITLPLIQVNQLDEQVHNDYLNHMEEESKGIKPLWNQYVK